MNLIVLLYALLGVLAIGVISMLIIVFKGKGTQKSNYKKYACHNNGASMDNEQIRAVDYDRIGML